MAKSGKNSISFETALAQLEEIIRSMESGDMPLDNALENYKKGTELLKLCQSKLNEAELQLSILENDELKPLDLENEK